VARSADPILFEDKIRENQRSDPKFSFLNPADPYHAYYRNRMERIAQGELLEDVSIGHKGAEIASAEPIVVEDVGLEPPVPEFILDLPHISNIDL
jgi:splicing factor 3A subunit 1